MSWSGSMPLAVNLLDSKVRDGEFKRIFPIVDPSSWATTWLERSSGGPKVRGFKAGDEVYARPRDHRIGTFAEFIAIDESDVALKPKNLSMVEAASIPLVGLTAWQALIETAKLKKGQKVFIQAGSGGVGTFAIQFAKHSERELRPQRAPRHRFGQGPRRRCRVDYRKEDFEKVLSGYDVVLNSQDAKTLEKSLNVLKPGGKLISISGPPDPEFAREKKLNLMLRLVLRLLSRAIRTKAKRRGVKFSFLFMSSAG